MITCECTLAGLAFFIKFFVLITFQKPQINFQSDDTNGRLVLAAAEAEVQGAGFPLLASPVRV